MSFNSKYTGAQVEAWLDNIKNYSANDILEKLKTVDGSNSGLDADLLDGKHLSDILASNVASATKLQTSRTIWGQSFDGTENVSGDLLFGNANIVGANNKNAFQTRDTGLYLGLGYTAAGDKTSLFGNAIHMYTGAGSQSMFINSSGNVTIGNSDLAGTSIKLFVDGAVKAKRNFIIDRYGDHTYWASGYYICGEENSLWGIGVYSNDKATEYYYIGNYGSEMITIRPNGNVGIGITSPNAKLDVNGNIHTTGSLTQDSDINLKNKVKDVLLSVDDIAEAPLFEFTYKSDKDKRIHVGTSAQYWVKKNNWFCKKQDNGYYDMEIQNLALASAISIAKEFKKYKEETESTISSMKKEIEELKQIVLNMNK